MPYITLITWKNDREVEVEINGNSEITKILIQVDGTIQLNSNVQPVKLATSEPKAGTIVTVTGWGALKVNQWVILSLIYFISNVSKIETHFHLKNYLRFINKLKNLIIFNPKFFILAFNLLSYNFITQYLINIIGELYWSYNPNKKKYIKHYFLYQFLFLMNGHRIFYFKIQ